VDYLGRTLEGYTAGFDIVSDNDATLVTVVSVPAGRGLLVSCGIANSTLTCYIKLTVDGVVVLNDVAVSYLTAAQMTTMIPFTTSLLLEMRLQAAGTSYFWAVTMVE